MESEMMKLAKVWLSVSVSLCFCYWISHVIPRGSKRLVSVLPVVSLFLFLPLIPSSVHFRAITGFFIAWLANFKLLLFAFGKGPLSSDPSISLGRFIALACLPIIIQRNPPQEQSETSKLPDQSDKNDKTPPPVPSEILKSPQLETNNLSSKTSNTNGQTKQNPTFPINSSNIYTPLSQYAIKGLWLTILVRVYYYSDYMHPKFILGLYCFLIYFSLELILAIVATMARALLGSELEPQFKNPLLSASPQDFWGRRWNLMVTNILRLTVYEPTRNAVRYSIGSKWASLPAVMVTFAVSGLMHELILYYLGRLEPTFRMTWFFLLHGFCVTVEIALKKTVTVRWRLPKLISGPLTVGLVMATCFWLFLPDFLRCQLFVRAFQEYAALGAFVKKVSHAFVV